jgi:hypothetical protein
LRVLLSQKFQNVHRLFVNDRCQAVLVLGKSSCIKLFHELDVIVNDVFSEENFGFFEIEKTIEHHVPAH